MIIFRDRIFLRLSVVWVLCIAGLFIFQGSFISTPKLSASPHTLSTIYDSSLNYLVLFFESSEDFLVESVKSIKNYAIETSFFSYILLLAVATVWKMVLVTGVAERKVSLDSLWQKTTTTL